MHVFIFEGYIGLAIFLALLVIKAFAFVSMCLWRADAFPAAGRLTKNHWLAITGIALLLQLPLLAGGLFAILNIAGTIAALVYLLDVRPALQSVTGRR